MKGFYFIFNSLIFSKGNWTLSVKKKGAELKVNGIDPQLASSSLSSPERRRSIDISVMPNVTDSRKLKSKLRRGLSLRSSIKFRKSKADKSPHPAEIPEVNGDPVVQERGGFVSSVWKKIRLGNKRRLSKVHLEFVYSCIFFVYKRCGETYLS